MKWHDLYPGVSLAATSAVADRWAQDLGIDFYKVRIQTNAHDITLVFSDLQIGDVPMGYVPFQVTDEATQTPC